MGTRRRRGIARITALIPLLAALSSLPGCDVSFGPEVKRPSEGVISISVADGSTLRKGDLIDLDVTLPADREAGAGGGGSEAYEVEIVLEGSSGSPVSRMVPYTPGSALPPITLDDLELSSQGYRMTVRLLQGGDVVDEASADFYFVGDEYQIKELTSDGPIVHPGSTVELAALLESPPDADPILEWSSGGKVFARGSLSQGNDRAAWTAPAAEGIYSISVALFPPALPEASVTLSTDVYVAVVSSPLGELSPASSYLGLFHFMGSLDNSGSAAPDASFLGGSPLGLVTRGKVVGYRLDGSGGIFVPELLLPLEGGELGPFTLTVGFTPGGADAEGPLLELASEDSGFLLRLGFESQGALLVAELDRGGETSRLEAPAAALRAERRSEISFSLYREAGREGLQAVLFIDGDAVADASWPATAPLGDVRGSTRLGGPSSVLGIVDELGIYVRDESGRAAPDPGIFARAALQPHAGVGFADGYDGLRLGPGYVTEGSVRVTAGAADVSSGARMRAPAFKLSQPGIRIDARFREPLGRRSILRIVAAGEGAGEELFSFSGDGRLAHGGESLGTALSGPLSLALVLRPVDQELRVWLEGWSGEAEDGAVLSLPLPEGESPELAVELVRPSEAQLPLRLDSIAIVPIQ